MKTNEKKNADKKAHDKRKYVPWENIAAIGILSAAVDKKPVIMVVVAEKK